MSTNVVYGLKCPIDGEIKYIGKSQTPQNRYMSHIQDSLGSSVKSSKEYWIRYLLIQGLLPEMVILLSDIPTEQLSNEEVKLIIEHSNGQLTNKVDNPISPNFYYKEQFDEFIPNFIGENSFLEIIDKLDKSLSESNYFHYTKTNARYLVDPLSRIYLKEYNIKIPTDWNYDINKAKEFCIPKFYGLTYKEIEYIVNNTEVINNLLVLLEKSDAVKKEYDINFG